MATRTHTRSHVFVTLANPHLSCVTCTTPVAGFHDPERCGPGCDEPSGNNPCGHAGLTSRCPSWSPVDGCMCEEKCDG